MDFFGEKTNRERIRLKMEALMKIVFTRLVMFLLLNKSMVQ